MFTAEKTAKTEIWHFSRMCRQVVNKNMSCIKRLDLQVQVIAVRRSIDGNTIYQYDKLN